MFVSGNTVKTLIATTFRKRPPPRNASEYFQDNRFASQSNKSTVLNTLASDHYLNFLTTAIIFFPTEIRHIRLFSASSKRPPDMIKTCSSNSFPPHPFAFPLVSSLAFTASFLPPVFISIFSISWARLQNEILTASIEFIGWHVFHIRSGHTYFQGQYSLYFFRFVCSIFEVTFFVLVDFVFNAFLAITLLQPLPGFQSYKRV